MPRLAELAALLGGSLKGPGDMEISGIGSLEEAGPDQISFLADERLLPRLQASRAGAVLIAAGRDSFGKPAIEVKDVREALLVLLARFAPQDPPVPPGVDPTALVDPSARVDEGASVGAHCVIGAGAAVGRGSVLGALCFVGRGAHVGEDCRIHPLVCIGDRARIGARVTIHSGAVLGADGFGFLPSPAGPRKVPQIGSVVVEDDVEIGANCTIDRATVGATTLKRGVKLDDQVHVAHNCTIGEGTVVAGQTGISGSVTVGRGVQFAGQVGVADHARIGDGVRVGAQSGISGDVPDNETVFGYPARPAKEAFRINAALARLPLLLGRIRELEAKVAGMSKRSARAGKPARRSRRRK